MIMTAGEERAWREGLWTGVVTTWACVAALAIRNRVRTWLANRSRT